jgi:hypothetical protein
MFVTDKLKRGIAAGAAALVVAGGVFGIVDATSDGGSSTATAATATHGPSVGHLGSGGGSNARSAPAEGGSSGTVTSVSGSSFTLRTSTGEKVTVKENSATAYQQLRSAASASAIKIGRPVLVLGVVSSTTIKATQVIVQPPSNRSAPSWAGKVVPFQRTTQGSSNPVGQIPASYSQGTGTIVSGTTAEKATEAALAVYPGGVVDRVVQLTNDEYEVHYIGVSWPHHIFVNQSFEVVGANS